MHPTVSVVMCTYNGAAYLEEQWDSITSQTHVPLEIVVCDDGSTDGTWQLLKSLAKRTSIPVRLIQNADNLGFIRNFEKAISEGKGELLALADQDDIWDPQKLAVAAAAFQADDALLLFFSDAAMIDDNGTSLGFTAWHCVGLENHWQALNAGEERRRLWVIHTVTGATIVMSRKLRPLALPFPDELLEPGSWHIHDGWLAAVAATCGNIRGEPKSLVQYRRHSNQVLGLSLPDGRIIRVSRDHIIERELLKTQPLVTHCSVLLREGYVSDTKGSSIHLLLAYNHHLQNRMSARSAPWRQRLLIVLKESAAGNYSRFSRGSRSALIDLLRR